MGFPPVPVARSRRALPPLLRRRVGGSLRSLVRLVGVCRGRSVSLFRLRAGRSRGSPFRPVPGRALGRFRPGPVVPPFASLAVGVCRRGPVRFVRRRVPLRAVLGSALAGPPRLLRRACGGRWVCGFRAGLPVRAAVPVGVARRACRPCGLGGAPWPLARFAVLLSGRSRWVVVLWLWCPAFPPRSRRACCSRLRRCARRCSRCSPHSRPVSGPRRSLRLACRFRRWWCASPWAVGGLFAGLSPGFCGLSRALPLSVPRVGSRRRGVFRLAPTVAGVRAARGRRRGLGARPWPFGRGRLRGWRRFVRSCRRSRCAGVFRFRVRFRSRCVRRPLGRPGAGCRGWRSRFRLRGVSCRAVPRWLVAVRSVVGLFLRVRFRLLGLRRVRGRSRFTPGRVPVWFSALFASAVGSLGSCRFWRLGGRVSVAVITVLAN